VKSLAIDNEDVYIGSGEMDFSQNTETIGNFMEKRVNITYSR